MRLTSVLAALGVLLATSAAPPATLRRMELPEIIRHSDAVVIGTVTSQQCVRDTRRPKLIRTEVTLTRLTVLHGSVKGADLTLSFAGGQINSQRVRVPGMPRFENGERVLLFVGLDRPWYCPVVGWHQGRFNLVRDEETGRQIVLDGAGKRVGGVAGGRVVTRPGGSATFDADDFAEAIRALLPPDTEERGEDGKTEEAER